MDTLNMGPDGAATDREAFDRIVYKNWAARFAVPVASLSQPGTTITGEERFAGSGGVHIWTIGQQAFALMDPACEPAIRQAMTRLPDPVALTAEDLASVLTTARIRAIENSALLYLYPPDFRPVAVSRPFSVRRLTLDDAQALDLMKAACDEAEVEMGEVSVEDEIGFGCFVDDQMVAVATGFRLTGFMDVGVLTHPAYRRRGLGKATVSALAAWCLEAELIAQYRCLTTNTGSHRIALGLGFTPYFTQQSIYLAQ